MPARAQATKPEPKAVLTKAALRATKALALSQTELAKIIGVSPPSVSRMASEEFLLDPETKQGELALLLLRVYRSLDSMLGGEQAKLVAWFHAQNAHLNGTPAELVRSPQGLVDVGNYLDAMRGKL